MKKINPKHRSLLIKATLVAIFVAAVPSCQCSDDKEPEIQFSELDAASEGANIVASSEEALRQVLLTKVQEDGFEGAVSYCKVGASVLTDSLSLVFNSNVRRTSFRFRNPSNKPDSLDKTVLALYEENFESNGSMDPVVRQTLSGQYRYYSPIRVQPFCTNCHGMPGESLTADLHALILETYPEDRAIGYEIGDFRGAWVVEFAESL